MAISGSDRAGPASTPLPTHTENQSKTHLDLKARYSKCRRGKTTTLPKSLGKPSLISVKPLDIPCLEASLKRVGLNAGPLSNFVDTEASVAGLIEKIQGLPTNPPSLYIDLEGINLSRHGSISILQVLIPPLDRTYLIDVHALKEKAFLQPASNGGQTLLDVLELPQIPKVFFDVCNDSDALFSQFNVELAGVVDLQLMELATRNFPRKYVQGLAKCIERDAPITTLELRTWKESKEKGLKLFDPGRGGTYGIFNLRPLPNDVIEYCVQDVRFLPKLWLHYHRKMSPKWKRRVATEATNRIRLSQTATYDAKGKWKALAPVGWA